MSGLPLKLPVDIDVVLNTGQLGSLVTPPPTAHQRLIKALILPELCDIDTYSYNDYACEMYKL